MTLPELMVAVGVGSLVLMFMCWVFADSARCFTATGNYVRMNSGSRNALDRMTQEIRRAADLTSFSSTRIQLSKYGATNAVVVYEWKPDTRQLTEWQTGYSQTNILLSECDQFAFALYKASFATTSNISEGKAIGVTWKCSRTVLGKKANTEDMEQALIVIRNKPL